MGEGASRLECARQRGRRSRLPAPASRPGPPPRGQAQGAGVYEQPGDDEAAMAQAVALGERGRETSAPNPWVGCVVVRDGRVIGEGYHHRAGEPHAEAHALCQAGELARGGTAYVTLEPF